MEIKDWIILFTPIVCNGVILAVLKELLDRKIDEYISRRRKHMIFYDQIYKDLLKAINMICKIEVLFLKEEYNKNEYTDFVNYISGMERYVENFISDKKLKKEIGTLDEKVCLFDACIGELCLYDLKDFSKSSCIISNDSMRAAKQLSSKAELINEEETINEEKTAFMIQYSNEAKKAEALLNDIKLQMKKLCKII